MKKESDMLSGKKFVFYNTKEFSFKQVIRSILKTVQSLKKIIQIKNHKIIFVFDKKFKTNSISELKESDNLEQIIIVRIGNEKAGFVVNSDSGIIDPFSIKRTPTFNIKKIVLSLPTVDTDKRIKTIKIASSSIFLGSMLRKSGFNFETLKINLSDVTNPRIPKDTDLLGFTLFEDTFIEFQTFIQNLKKDKNILFAAGGPFITLNPLKAVYHLPEINLFVRGEAEFILPRILNSINNRDLEHLVSDSGFLFQFPGVIIISDFSKVNYPENFSSFNFYLDFLKPSQFSNGLEMNFSRGCSKNCIFCSRVQGRNLRKLNAGKIKELLNKFRLKLQEIGKDIPEFRTVNINDDDILQDKNYATSVFDIMKKEKFSVWGIQSSISSFFDENFAIHTDIVDRISNDFIFVNEKILWLGTDTFLQERGKRLGKILPPKHKFVNLINEFEIRKIYNYHYWISSDHLSSWEEFSNELIFLFKLYQKFNYFKLLPHAPFLVPYPSTAAYRLIHSNEFLLKKVIFRKRFRALDPEFDMDIIERVETGFHYLNELLKNVKPVGREGFFDYLKSGDILNALINAYTFIKKERLSYNKHSKIRELKNIESSENEIYELISKYI